MTSLSNWLQQVFALLAFSLGTLHRRLGSSVTAAVGVAGVVGVMVAVLSMAQGFRATMDAAGSADVALVLRSGANDEMSSGLGREETRLIAEKPGVARDENGPIASAELFVTVDVPRRNTGTDANVPLRGVEPQAFTVRERLEIVEGRRFDWGKNEVIVGKGAQASFRGLDVGSQLRWGKNTWTVTGTFEDGGSVAESEIWTDARVLQPAYQRGDSFQSVRVRLTSPQAFTTFEDALTTDPRLETRAVPEREYYESLSRVLVTLIHVLGYLVAGVMAVGATFGALNTMYNAVSSRTREIATLRALGFGSGPVMLSVLGESMLLALTGGIAGSAAAWIAFDGFRAATMNWQTFSQVSFAFAVTPTLVVQGLVWALAVGFLGGLLPAMRAVRMPVATALREL
jgi:putative ABC transport system permease protein